VVVGDFDVVGIAGFPSETDAVLVVNPNAELPFPVAFQGFQPVARRCLQIVQFGRRPEVFQLPLNLPFYIYPSVNAFALCDLLRFFIRE